MKNAILFGNGINRSCDAISWSELIKKIADEFYAGNNNNISATIEYEKIACKVLVHNTNLSADNFCMDIIKKVNDIPGDYKSIYNKFLEIPINIILTTNYDYAIEHTLDDNFVEDEAKKYIYFKNENKCSSKRHTVLNNKFIYHIHGELTYPKSVCLGTIRYIENLNKIFEDITEKDDLDNVRLKKIKEENDINCSWAQFIFSKNIYIVGLGLADCDIDLWWLIIFRARLIANGEKITNKIVYYYIYEEGKKEDAFMDCLKEFKIEVREKEINCGTWREEYIKIAKNIKKDISLV